MTPGGTVSDRRSTATWPANRLVTRSSSMMAGVMNPALGKRGAGSGSREPRCVNASDCASPRLLGGHGRGFVRQRRVQGVPRENRALDPGRELAHAGERRELAQRRGVGGGVGTAGDHVVERMKEPIG